jgi:hypothetical protein
MCGPTACVAAGVVRSSVHSGPYHERPLGCSAHPNRQHDSGEQLSTELRARSAPTGNLQLACTSG